MQDNNITNDQTRPEILLDEVMIEELELRLELAVCCHGEWQCRQDWTGRCTEYVCPAHQEYIC